MVMDVSDDDRLLNEESDAPEDAVDDGSYPNKKKCCRVPKRALKAEREKLKRDHLNGLFDKLGSLLELSEQNNGKASILNETIRLLKDMISQIQSLRMENATLLSESHYVTIEKNELKEENSALELQIKSVQGELEEKVGISKPDLNVPAPECWQPETGPHFPGGHLSQPPPTDTSTHQPPILAPMYVIPINPDFHTFQKADIAPDPPVPVRKPHPRYPTPADSWPLHLLSKQPETTNM
ncbi:transcription factor bHLH47-like [Silene latifolia]|uniref:transcription factor bHLH47-like n=1 Tax=Silene latifolia TaxID=37657 RepID=UPI003D784B06